MSIFFFFSHLLNALRPINIFLISQYSIVFLILQIKWFINAKIILFYVSIYIYICDRFFRPSIGDCRRIICKLSTYFLEYITTPKRSLRTKICCICVCVIFSFSSLIALSFPNPIAVSSNTKINYTHLSFY